MADFYTGEPYSGDWRLISDNPVLGVRQFRLDIGDGQYVVKTEHYVTDALLDLNAERRAAQAGRAWGDGQLVASVPLNVAWKDLMQAVNEKDEAHVRRWLNDPDHAKFRTREGKL